jgi:two-component system, NarL family, invasion response regulator UvrY
VGLADREQRRAGDDRMAITPVRVLVVDDDEACRGALADVVSAAAQFTLVGCAESGQGALQLLPSLEPDLVLLDVRMPGLDGPETARRIRKTQPEAVVVLVSANRALASRAASCGAAAFVQKSKLSPARLGEVWAQTRANAAEPAKNLAPPESDS